MDDRDRRAPVTLPRNAPVTQTILRLTVAPALGFGLGNDIGFCVVDRHAVQEMRINDLPRAGISDITVEIALGQIAISNDTGNTQIIFAREIEVALVVRGTAENSTGAVIHQHEIGDIDGQMPARVERMFDR